MKILKYFISFVMAAGLMTSCSKDLEEVQAYAPENVVAPTIHALDVTEIVITADNQTETLTFSWDAADFGAPTQISYSVQAAYGGNELAVTTGVTENEAVLTYEALNTTLALSVEDGGLGCPNGQPAVVTFRIGASIGATYPTVYSETVELTVSTTSAEKQFPMIYMPGSYQNWSPENAATNFQVLYDFAGKGVFEGIADFGQAADDSRAWKFTVNPDWSFDYGIPSDVDQTTIAEAASVALYNNDDGDRSDIKIYTKNRYYHFSMDTNTKTLTKNYAFDMVGVIGVNGDWNNDIEMTFNAAKRRFYADVENLSGDFKFRADADWAVNWGGSNGQAVSGGDNIVVETAGNYRIYLYLSDSNDLHYELNADMYGQEGDGVQTPVTPPAPEVEKGGKFIYVNNQDGWAATYLYTWNAAGEESTGLTNSWPGKEMTATVNVDGVEYVGYEMPESTNGMSINYIFNNNDGAQTADPAAPIVLDRNYYFTIKDGVATEVTVEEVSYKLFADVTATGWENVNIWAWDDDGNNYSGGNWPGVALTETVEMEGITYWVFEMPANATGKTIGVIFNNGTEQTVDLTGVVMDKDHTFTLTEKDGDKWLATIDGAEAPKPEVPVVVLGDHTWGLIGVNGDWGADVAMTAEDGWMVAKDVTFDAADSEFKVRADGDWTISYGTGKEYAVVGGEAFELTYNADNILMPAAGTYDIYFTIVDNVASMKVVGEASEPSEPEQPAAPAPLDIELGIVGDHNGWQVGQGTDIIMEWNGALYVAKNVALEGGKGFKVRKADVWNDSYNWGPSAKAEVPVNGSIDVQNGSGSQDILIPATGTYDIYFDYAALKVWLMEAGAKAPEVSTPVAPEQPSEPEQPSTGGVEIPADVTLGVVGDHTAWSDDSVMTLENGYYVAKGVALEAGKGFKVRKVSVWDNAYNFGPSAASEIAVNGSLDVVNGSGAQNILVSATGTYDIYFDNHAMKVWMMEAGKTPAK